MGDPTDAWYGLDPAFFESYVIPLANQLHACGMMDGSKVGNLVKNAKDNLEEWKKHGEAIVSQYVLERKRAKKKKTNRRASMCDSFSSADSLLSDLTDYDDYLSDDTDNLLLSDTLVRISNTSLVEGPRQKPQMARDASKLSKKSGSKSRKKSRLSHLSPKKPKKGRKKQEKTVPPPPLLSGVDFNQASRKGKSSRPRPSSAKESRKGKSRRRKSELASSRHSAADSKKGLS